MPIECQVLLRSPEQEGESGDSQKNDTETEYPTLRITRRPCNPMPPAPALNDLIRALERSPPDKKELRKYHSKDDTMSGDDRKSSAFDMIGDSGGDTATTKARGGNGNKNRVAGGGRKKPTVSDDDDNRSRRKKRRPNSNPIAKKESPIIPNSIDNSATPPSTAAATINKPHVRMMEDFSSTIEDAVREQRIDEKKAERLHECLQAGDWSEVAYSLLCEQIPLKRKGKGYSCRVCGVPKKGHSCPYCHICSTAEERYKKDDEHVCINCPVCFEDGKKRKKLMQIRREGHVCPHGA